GASARGAGSLGSVSCGIKSPPMLFGLTWSAIGAERIERPPRGLRPRIQPLHHAPPIFQGAELERTRSQYAGKPATGSRGLCVVATRVMVAKPQGLHIFQHGGIHRFLEECEHALVEGIDLTHVTT